MGASDTASSTLLASGNHLPQHLRAPPCTTSSRGRSPFPGRLCLPKGADDSESERAPSRSPEPVPIVVEQQQQVPPSPPPPPPAEFPAHRRVSWQQNVGFEGPQGLSDTASPRQFPAAIPSPPPSPERGRPPQLKLNQNQKHTDTMANANDTSADETTSILGNERGRPGARRGYSSTVTSQPQPSSQQAEVASPPEGDTSNQAQSSSSSSPRSSRRRRRQSQQKDSRRSWWKDLSARFGSVELENRGSVARDHLALERTFLAWLRTSLSFASIGIAVTQLFRLNTSLASQQPDAPHGSSAVGPTTTRPPLHHVGKPLGATFLSVGILVLAIGFHRYFESQHYVIMGKFPASRASILIVSSVAGALIVASLAVILVVAPADNG